MSWRRAWKWLFTLALIVAARNYLIQEVATILLVLAAACGILFLFSVFSVGCSEAINRGIELLEPRLRSLGGRTRAVFSQSFFHLPVVPGQGLFLLLPVLVKPVAGAVQRLRSAWNPRREFVELRSEVRPNSHDHGRSRKAVASSEDHDWGSGVHGARA